MHADSDCISAIQPLMEEGWVDEILYEVKSGKEATVFCCAGGNLSPVPLIAAKVYRPIESRRFKNDAMYTGGRMHLAREGRAKRAVQNKSTFGRKVQYGTWLYQEWEVLKKLYEAGVVVPQPLAFGERVVLMPFIGDESGAAPMLHEIRLDRNDVVRVVDDVIRNIELMLDLDCVHGDLSPYNIMYHEEKAIIIDFPQAVDPRLNNNGYMLLSRDINNICDWAAKHKVHRPAGKILSNLWTQFILGDLG